MVSSASQWKFIEYFLYMLLRGSMSKLYHSL